MTKLLADVKRNGSGKNYLIQHSAGSGKSNSIAWLAHRLAGLHTANDEKIFQSAWHVMAGGISIVCTVVGYQKYRLAVLMKGNVPVEHPHYFAIFEECRRAYGLHQVALRQNDLITSPITEGLFKNQVVLPFSSYTDTELRMIYEHELTHIKNKDLHWRIFALVTSWIHWFNPVIYLQKK